MLQPIKPNTLKSKKGRLRKKQNSAYLFDTADIRK